MSNYKNLVVSILQLDLIWQDKVANRSKIEYYLQKLPPQRQVVLLPEMFSTGFSMTPEKFAETMHGPTVSWMRSMAIKFKIILAGSLIIEEGGKYYNRMVWMQPDGTYACYDKRHLFGYAGEDAHYTVGEHRTIVSVNGWKILLQVCYDLRFPVWSRQAPSEAENFEFDAIVYTANWPEKRIAAWNTLLPARAIENQSFVIGVNRVGTDGNGFYHNGSSQIIDPQGQKRYEKTDIEDTFTIELNREELEKIRQRFPFAKDADRFFLLSRKIT